MRNAPRHFALLQMLFVPALLVFVLLVSSPSSAQPPVPILTSIFPPGGQRGTTVELVVGGTDLDGVSEVRITGEGLTASLLEDEKPAGGKPKPGGKTTPRVSVQIAPDAELGQHDLRLITPGGVSNRFRFTVGEIAEINEVEQNSEKHKPQQIESLPVLINGQITPYGRRADVGDIDFFRFPAKAGEKLVFELQGQKLVPFVGNWVPGWLQASLTLYDRDGKELKYVDDFRFHPDPVMVYDIPEDGQYVLKVQDTLFRGQDNMVYRLRIGTLPFITHIFPLGCRRDSTAKLELHGFNLPADSTDLKIPADSPTLRYVQSDRDGVVSNTLPLAVGEMPEAPEAEPNDSAVKANKIETPVTVNGRIGQVGDVDCFTFKVEAQQKLIMEVRARRLDSPLDSIVALFDSKGQELAEDDDTVDLGAGTAIHHADSQVVYTFPSAGDYVLKLRDAQSKGGEEYAYRLTVAAPRPDFLVQITPDNPRLGQGGSATLTAYAARRGDFGGEVRIAAKDLPQGFVLSDAVIPAGQNRVRLTVTAPVDAPLGIISPTFTGTATIGTKEIVREAVPVEDVAQAFAYQHKLPTKEFLLTVMESASLVMSADVPPKQVLEIPQGGAAELVLKVSRKKGTKGAVQLAKYAPVIEGMATMPVAELITVKPVTVAPTKSEAKITVAASVEAPVGLMECIVITGDMKAGKETFTGVAPAISVKVVAPKSKKK